MGLIEADHPPGRAAAPCDFFDHVDMGMQAVFVSATPARLDGLEKTGCSHQRDIRIQELACFDGFTGSGREGRNQLSRTGHVLTDFIRRDGRPFHCICEQGRPPWPSITTRLSSTERGLSMTYHWSRLCDIQTQLSLSVAIDLSRAG